jgi:type IV pilus assembly protein PilM
MQKILGLDIGSYSIKAVEILNTFNNYKVTGFHEIVVPEIEGLDAADVGMTVVRQLFQQHDLQADKIYTGIMGALASTRILELQNVKKRNMGPVVMGELETQAPFRLEDVVIDHQILDQRNGASSVLAVMARKDDVQAYLHGLRTLGIEPKVIDVDYLSYMNLCPFLGGADDAESSDAVKTKMGFLRKRRYRLFVDIGHQKTSILYFCGSRLVAARTVRMAGRYFTEQLQKALGVTFGEAQRIKHAVSRIECDESRRPPAGGEREHVVARYLGASVLELVREISRTLHSFAAQEKAVPEMVFLSGGSTRIEGLRELMESSLGVSVRSFAFDSEKLVIDEDLAHQVDLLIQPLALALRGVSSKRQSQINLRKGELALVGSYDKVVRQIGNVSMLVGSLLVCLLASYMLRWYLYGNQISAMRNEYRESVKKILKTEPTDLSRLASKPGWNMKEYALKAGKLIDQEVAEADSAVRFFTERESVYPLRVLEAVSKGITKTVETREGADGAPVKRDLVVDLLEFSVQGRTVNMEGETDSRASAEAVGSLLKDLPIFQKVDLTHAAKAGSDKIIKFRVQGSLKEEL